MSYQKKSVKKSKRSKKRRKGIVRSVLMLFVAVVCVLAGVKVMSIYLEEIPAENEIHVNDSVLKPVKWDEEAREKKLRELSETNSAAKEIYENRSSYPDTLLSAYLNNQEMENFVKGYLEADKTVTKGFTKKELKKSYPLLLQWDERWGYGAYGNSIIGLSGCGPTCLSMVLLALTGDEEATPYAVAKFSEENGYYVEGSGTSWSLMTEGAEQYGLTQKELPLSEMTMKEELDEGHPIICSMGAGDFTTQGHFIVIYGYDETGFQINDPNCIARSNRTWSYEELSYQIKNLWSYQG